MKKLELSDKEKLMIFGLVKYPQLTDKQLSEKLDLKHSTVTSIRQRLKIKEFYRTLKIPMLHNMGCEMLVAIYTSFNPLIPLEERVKITGKTIEVFEEIFYSIGEQDKGFSLSLSENYGTIGRINDIRTQTFGGRELLEDEYPNMVVFPFQISKIYRFFDFAPLLENSFEIMIRPKNKQYNSIFWERIDVSFSDTEKNVYCMLTKYPEASDNEIGMKLGISRHTVSRLRRNFQNKNILYEINLPNLKKLGFEILSFFHIRFDPRNPPDMSVNDAALLMTDSTVFMASRMFEAFMILIHTDYNDYTNDRNRIMQMLKENKWVAQDPLIRTFSLKDLIFIKDFIFAPIAKKIIGCDIHI
jgi:DNA-binding CsgD family transcriptional regulator